MRPRRPKTLHDQFVHVAGAPAACTIEQHPNPAKVDHVWIDITSGEFGLIRISLNTRSTKCGVAGFDDRVRLGIAESKWSSLPRVGVTRSDGFDYSAVEKQSGVTFDIIEEPTLQNVLIDKGTRAIFAEAWGDLYVRGEEAGVHQIHSRRASVAVTRDLVGRDGAIAFFFEDHRRELLLMKFMGQP